MDLKVNIRVYNVKSPRKILEKWFRPDSLKTT